MSSRKSSTSAKASEAMSKLDEAILIDLVKHTSQRVYAQVSDSMQLLDNSKSQHRLVLALIVSLTWSAAVMLSGKREPTIADIERTLDTVMGLLKGKEVVIADVPDPA